MAGAVLRPTGSSRMDHGGKTRLAVVELLRDHETVVLVAHDDGPHGPAAAAGRHGPRSIPKEAVLAPRRAMMLRIEARETGARAESPNRRRGSRARGARGARCP